MSETAKMLGDSDGLVDAAHKVRKWLENQPPGSTLNGMTISRQAPHKMSAGMLLKGLVLAVGKRGTIRISDENFEEAREWSLVVRPDDTFPDCTVFWATPGFDKTPGSPPVSGTVVAGPEIISGGRGMPAYMVDVSIIEEHRQLLAAAIHQLPGRRLEVSREALNAIKPGAVRGGDDRDGWIRMWVPGDLTNDRK